MADEVSPQYPLAVREQQANSGWAVGLTLFAAMLMIMAALFQALGGLVAIVNDAFYVSAREYLYQFNVTTWGWIHPIGGVVVGLAGWAVLSGQTWGRVIGIILAVLSAIAAFMFIPYYPFWALLVIALDVFAVWGACRPRPQGARCRGQGWDVAAGP
jgi:hypothetical protein